MHTESLEETQKAWHGNLRSYLIGFLTSLLLTVTSFALVAFKLLSGTVLGYVLSILAMTQAIVQLRFFLHVGQEAKPKWESVIFAFMALVLLIIILGSLWIMSDLDQRMMPSMTPREEM